ncbi:helix-turn-helix domain-containing protein [Macrococcus brunensis]|uniref:helix-turn-helix domain-containing protein n=1 Tax=Macrococcus brunensis TaxID=198483 RepID=UPI001EF10030|nr:helix-turn-helix transcriptional regulator [Macrococcus brunensis]ULG73695.1 helix-turn-helix domain-containing protein [Macrococcus brunensis]
MKNNEIVAAIKWHRENNEIPSKEIACILGHSQSKYSKIENGEQYLTAEELTEIAAYLNLDINKLIKMVSYTIKLAIYGGRDINYL